MGSQLPSELPGVGQRGCWRGHGGRHHSRVHGGPCTSPHSLHVRPQAPGKAQTHTGQCRRRVRRLREGAAAGTHSSCGPEPARKAPPPSLRPPHPQVPCSALREGTTPAPHQLHLRFRPRDRSSPMLTLAHTGTRQHSLTPESHADPSPYLRRVRARESLLQTAQLTVTAAGLTGGRSPVVLSRA